MLLLMFDVYAGRARAQTPRPAGSVLVELEPLVLQPRLGAPLVVDMKLTWSGKGMLRGDLEFTAEDDLGGSQRVLARFRVPDLALTDVPQTIRQLLPPLDVQGGLPQATIRGRFVTSEHAFAFDERTLFVAAGDRRVFTVAVASGWGDLPPPGIDAIANKALPFERFDPEAGRSEPKNRAVSVSAWLDREQFPRDALELCTFNLVVLVDEGLSDLRQEHLDAVLKWVSAGGSVFVRPGALVQPRHVGFLNALIHADAPGAGFRLDQNNRLAWPEELPRSFSNLNEEDRGGLYLLRRGLGRVVLAAPAEVSADEAGRTFRDSPAWREAAWFLWKLRQQLRPGVVEQGRWIRDRVEVGNGPPVRQEGRFRPRSFAVVPLQSGDWLLQHLIPESVSLVPMWIIGCILGLFLLAVGPVDYYVLGLVRRRKLTWIVFPIVAIVFAWFTVWLSNRYMQSSDQQRSLVLLDVGEDGEIVRSNELRLHFTNTSRTIETPAAGELVVSLAQRKFGSAGGPAPTPQRGRPAQGTWVDPQTGIMYVDGQPVSYTDGRPVSTTDVAWSRPLDARQQRRVDPPQLSGLLPDRYVMIEQIPQWTPHLNRLFSIAARSDQRPFDWTAIRSTDLADDAGVQRVFDRVAAALGDNAVVAVLHQGELRLNQDRFGLFGRHTPPQHGGAPLERSLRSNLLIDLCVRSGDVYALSDGLVHTGDLFALVSQLAPTGGDNFEDLPLLDPSDPNQWLLVVVVPQGNDWHVYRKLYFTE